MKPISVTISAFGPFADTTEIPLNKLGADGLYLITGDTGAGKTTVFDAICFSLYGEASGVFRSKASDYRCTYANPNVPTFVKYEFEYNSRRYIITRNPEYERPKLKSQGTTKETAKAELILPGGEVITRLSDVNKAIEELIGLSYSQFTQISMLAQGEFQKLLNADTKDRIEIFRKIFNTQSYQIFQLKLKDRFLALEREYNEQKRAVNQYIESISYSDDEQINIRIDEVKASEVYVTDEICSILNTICNLDTAAQAELALKIEQLDKQIEILASNVTVAESAENAGKELILSQEQLKLLTEKLTVLKSALDSALADRPLREQMLSQIGALQNEMAEYDRLQELISEGKKASASIKSSADESCTEKQRLEQLHKDLANLKEELSALDKIDATLSDARHDFETESERYKQLKELEAALKELDRLIQLLNKAKADYTDIRNKFTNATACYNNLEQLFFDAQAGVLSERLIDGIACPVCGSTEHPSPAVLLDNAPTQEQLKSAKSNLDSLQSDVQKAAISAEKARISVDTLDSDIKIKTKKLLGDENISSLSTAVSYSAAIIAELEKKISDLDRKSNRRTILLDIIPKSEKSAEELQSKISKLISDIAAYTERRNQLLAQYNDVISRLKFKSKQDAQKALKELFEKTELIKKQIDTAEQNYNACNEELHRTEERIASLKQIIEAEGEYDVQSLKSELVKATSSRTDLRAEYQRISIRLSRNTDILESITKVSAYMTELSDKIKNLSAISNTANGTLSKKDKLLFETYIQMTWFDRVIIMANQRFTQMTGGQYRLIRRTVAENRQSQSGLDLNVIDYKNGTTRSVKTLSGGESFKASLSLALGLSDVVQSISGGIHLDAMFIDEGFGSLDEESLSQAITVLRELSSSNRSVAIISHVAELKHRIDNQLIITKDAEGISRIRIEI